MVDGGREEVVDLRRRFEEAAKSRVVTVLLEEDGRVVELDEEGGRRVLRGR